MRIVSKGAYSYRAYIEEKTWREWLGFGKEVTKYRYVVQSCIFLGKWEYYICGGWHANKETAIVYANRYLDVLSNRKTDENREFV